MAKKKIGILTFHGAHNYGADLQAYGLRTYLRKQGYEAVILNYTNKAIGHAYDRILHPNLWKRHVLPKYWGYVLRETKKCIYSQKTWRRLWKAFDDFIGEVLLEGDKRKLSLADLEQSDCDVFILGSDQIWASELTHGLDPAYFGEFQPGKPKLSYAASLYDATIPERERDAFKEKLQGLCAISVREEKLAVEIRELLGCEAYTVCDPSLLLTAGDYEELLEKNKSFLAPCPAVTEKRRYVFAYYVVESELLSACARETARQLDCELIELHYYRRPEEEGITQLFDLGPLEFLEYIKNAAFVVTNSFHGTVFSAMFRRKFYSAYEVNGRIENLLGVMQLEQRHVNAPEQIQVQDEIDYEKAGELLTEYRKSSENFLHMALESK